MFKRIRNARRRALRSRELCPRALRSRELLHFAQKCIIQSLPLQRADFPIWFQSKSQTKYITQNRLQKHKKCTQIRAARRPRNDNSWSRTRPPINYFGQTALSPYQYQFDLCPAVNAIALLAVFPAASAKMLSHVTVHICNHKSKLVNFNKQKTKRENANVWFIQCRFQIVPKSTTNMTML